MVVNSGVPAGAMKCACGKGMRLLASNFFHCPACGRSKWGDESISGAEIVVIVILTILTIIVLGYVGAGGAKYRA
jgi:hypothetical protein